MSDPAFRQNPDTGAWEPIPGVHQRRLVNRRGWQATCTCGWQAGVQHYKADAMADHDRHVEEVSR
jgi:hypothetical protein